jgi:hypothetical protein
VIHIQIGHDLATEVLDCLVESATDAPTMLEAGGVIRQDPHATPESSMTGIDYGEKRGQLGAAVRDRRSNAHLEDQPSRHLVGLFE